MFPQDETMHSGADVEAFTAALNRHIEGGDTSTSQPADSGGGNHLRFSFTYISWLITVIDPKRSLQKYASLCIFFKKN